MKTPPEASNLVEQCRDKFAGLISVQLDKLGEQFDVAVKMTDSKLMHAVIQAEQNLCEILRVIDDIPQRSRLEKIKRWPRG